jgi:hypothetical protein
MLQAIHSNGMGRIGRAVHVQPMNQPQQQLQQQPTSQQPSKNKVKKSFEPSSLNEKTKNSLSEKRGSIVKSIENIGVIYYHGWGQQYCNSIGIGIFKYDADDVHVSNAAADAADATAATNDAAGFHAKPDGVADERDAGDFSYEIEVQEEEEGKEEEEGSYKRCYEGVQRKVVAAAVTVVSPIT